MLKDKRINIYLWGDLEARTTKLAEALQRAGASVTVVTWVDEIPLPKKHIFDIEYNLIPKTQQGKSSVR